MAKPDKVYDVLIIGGGINGVGIARDAAGRGLSVMLCEQHDLAQHTSSASTKLVHGGLRYLEHYEFRLVRKALQEREVLMRSAPHIIWPLRFIMPHQAHLRPKWMIRAGLFLYDHLAQRTLLPASHFVNFRKHMAGSVLKSELTSGFEYSDGWVYDARLVVLNAIDAQERGAVIRTRTTVVSAERFEQEWHVKVASASNGIDIIRAKTIVNAAGPWAASLLSDMLHSPAQHHLRLVKGSHIIVKSLFAHPYAYIFQHVDQRIVFAIPYEGDFTLIGTTDVEFHGHPESVQISPEETQYLCDVVNTYFKKSISPADVVSSYAGVRPLLEDAEGSPASVTRDYQLDMNLAGAPVLSVFGGKITTYRRLAEDALDKLSEVLPLNGHPNWTASSHLPGGDMDAADFDAFLKQQATVFPWLPVQLLRRYARLYGTRMVVLLEASHAMGDLGLEIAPDLFEVEVNYLIRHEWARTAEDILWRRTKLGLFAKADDVARLQQYLNQHNLTIQ